MAKPGFIVFDTDAVYNLTDLASVAYTVVNKTSAYTLTADDMVILCDASGAAFTITLPAAANNAGKWYHIKKVDSSANAVTVDGNSSETIDDSLTAIISIQYTSIMILCDGSNWYIL